MKFSYNWISEFVEGLDVNPTELGQLITEKTAECEGVETFGAHMERVCAARVISAEPIPDSRNKVVTVETGRYGTRTVVCGAPNCRAGITTAYVPAGTKLGDVEIRRAEIRGVVSDGMLASGQELRVNRDPSGILEIKAEPGDPIPGCKPDHIIDIDNKSITHRPDLWGHFGMAREVAAILRKPLKDPVNMDFLPSGEGDIVVRIDDFNLCPRYSGLTFENITVHPSPLWMQYRLESIGLNPISNMVDVTNYVMSEIAEPMHAFDRDTLRDDRIVVRPAKKGESIIALNGETYELDGENLVIADAEVPVAIGGVIGGLSTGVSENTRRIVLEAANFNASSIRKTSCRLRLRTDASMRFEKAQDPHNTVRGLARAVELFGEVSPGFQVIGGLSEAMREIPKPPQIALHTDWLQRKLGHPAGVAEVTDILTSLEFGVEKISEKTVAVTVPSWRATRDVSIKEDLVEEVGRMIGYETITPVAPMAPSEVPPANEELLFHHDVRALVSALGYTEVYNYSFVSNEVAREFSMDPADHVRVVNPIAADLELMRTSLTPGIVRNIRENSKHSDSFRLFEIGFEIHKQAGSEGAGEGLPDEADHLGAAIYSRAGDGREELFEVKRLAESLMPGATLTPAEARPFEHPVRSYEVEWRGEKAGRIFEMHPAMVEGRAAMLDVDLRAMRSLQPKKRKYKPLRRYPVSAFDLSVVAGLRELAGDLQKKLASCAGDNLESIEFLRQYTGKPLPEDKQSVSYRLTVFAPDHTLTTEEVTSIRQRIIDGMKDAGYELRV